MQEGALTLGGGCDPSWFYRQLDSLGFLADSVVPQVVDPWYQCVH